jgi:hypothetical protein
VEVVADFFYEYRVRDRKIVFLRFVETWDEALAAAWDRVDPLS